MPAAAGDGFGREGDVCDAELGVADGLFAEGAFACGPAEALADRFFDGVEEFLVDLVRVSIRFKQVIQE